MSQDQLRGVPRDINVMREYMKKMYELRGHIAGVRTNPATNALVFSCNLPGGEAPDVYMPMKRGKQNEGTALLQRIASAFSMGYPASDSDVLQLFDMIDQHAR